jgi:hypothetical protein
MRDAFDCHAPLGVSGRIAEVLFLTGYMRRLFSERNRVVKCVAESGACYTVHRVIGRMTSDNARLFRLLDDLIDRWCERRALHPLRLVLAGYPPAPALTDEWAELYAALRNLTRLPVDGLTSEERAGVADAHALIHRILKATRAGADIIRAAG